MRCQLGSDEGARRGGGHVLLHSVILEELRETLRSADLLELRGHDRHLVYVLIRLHINSNPFSHEIRRIDEALDVCVLYHFPNPHFRRHTDNAAVVLAMHNNNEV